MADERPTPQSLATGLAPARPTAGAAPRQAWVWATVGAVAVALAVACARLNWGGAPPTGTAPLFAVGDPDEPSGDADNSVLHASRPPDAIFAQASPAVVQIVTQDRQGRDFASGSGFLVSASGLIVTNHHVIAEAHTADVIFADKAVLPVVGAAALDQRADLAVLKITGRIAARPLELAGDKLPSVGAKVYAIGSPLGSFSNTLSDGLVSGHRETGTVPLFPRMPTLIQTTAPISHGSSGGPLLRADGKVVGVMTLTFASEGENLNFAVPVCHVARLLRRSEAGGQLTHFPLVRPAEVFAYIERGNAWMAQNDYGKAIEEFGEAVRIDPTCALAYYRRGMALYRSGEFAKAFRDFDEASRLDPKRFKR